MIYCACIPHNFCVQNVVNEKQGNPAFHALCMLIALFTEQLAWTVYIDILFT